MHRLKPSIDYKLDLLEARPVAIQKALHSLSESILRRDLDQEKVRTQKLGQVIAEAMALSDLLGRRRALVEYRSLASKKRPPFFSMGSISIARFASTAEITPVPKVPFMEAVDAITSREPMLAKSADDVREAYGTGGRGFALLRLPQQLADKARLTLTRRIQGMLASKIERGGDIRSVREQLSDMAGFSKAYAETVYRTNLAHAFTEGRFAQLQDPEVADIIPALEYTDVGDSSTRPTHHALGGFVAGLDHPEWRRIKPPNGFNCRCDARSVDRWELKSRGLLRSGGHVMAYYPPSFSQGGPDPGFKKGY